MEQALPYTYFGPVSEVMALVSSVTVADGGAGFHTLSVAARTIQIIDASRARRTVVDDQIAELRTVPARPEPKTMGVVVVCGAFPIPETRSSRGAGSWHTVILILTVRIFAVDQTIQIFVPIAITRHFAGHETNVGR